jgi:hypothetical protein
MTKYGAAHKALAASFSGAQTAAVEPYHTPRRVNSIAPEKRPFIAWDGEGRSYQAGRPQSYILFGCSTGDRILQDGHIHTFDLLDFIVRIGEQNPSAFHVGFAFNYDANMILQSLSKPVLEKLHKNGRIALRNEDGRRYNVSFLPSKWFRVTRYKEGYHYKTNPHAKVTVTIYDIFGFFGKSFIAAYEELVGPVPDVVSEGKARRDDFNSLPLEYVDRYWTAEIGLLQQLAEELRRRLYGAGLRITKWHGPGALASYALRQHGIKKAMRVCPDEVREAARYGYAGGRFEIFKLGRITGPIYSLDINSAYPYGITRLPDLTTGEWIQRTGQIDPRKLARFGIYRVRLNPRVEGSFLETGPGPLFHRDKLGNITFPWMLEGWYWSPEVLNLRHLDPSQYTILEGWEYLGHKRANTPPPFEWVGETYQLRREWKEKGWATQLALKLLLNSIYGKLAQRVGWNEEKRTAPAWHQLEWAGWVTSNCRAMLWDVMSRMPTDKLIAVETDGIYTLAEPHTLGISNSRELGGWEVEVYDEILYVQSGMAWLRKGDKWTCKRRGLDARTFPLDDCMAYLGSLKAKENWPPYVGQTTRFIGLGAALMSPTPFRVRHCRWETVNREIRPGQSGKRVHIHKQCRACSRGQDAYASPHDMSIRSNAYGEPHSYPHDIPWEGDTPYDWRDYEQIQGEIVV